MVMTDAAPFGKQKFCNDLGVLDEFDKANVSAFAAPLHDMHCHVGFMDDPTAFVCEASNAKAQIYSVSVTPFEYKRLLESFSESFGISKCQTTGQFSAQKPTVYIALGLHPWWVPNEVVRLQTVLREFDAYVPTAPYIGEVGLDFSSRRVGTKSSQIQAINHIVNACAEQGNKVISFHCVQADDELLSLLEASGAYKTCTCIFHWFSGSSEHLKRARQLGCYFSVNARMLSSKRGREYVKAIPENKLLLETDAPPVSNQSLEIVPVPYAYKQVEEELRISLEKLSKTRRQDSQYLAGLINKNVQLLFSLKNLMQ